MRFSFEKKDFVETNVSPEKLAIVGADFNLTWLQFRERVEGIYAEFEKIKCKDLRYPVILYGHKSTNMVVAMYAMIKMEIPYIPIDPVFPKDRILKMIKLSNSQVVLNTTSDTLRFEDTSELALDSEGITYSQRLDTHEVGERDQDPLVYILFTSGSTGEPKGVQITYSSLHSFVNWMSTDFGFTSEDVFINTVLTSFDVSVLDIMTFGALGATIILNDRDSIANPDVLMDRVQEYRGTIWVSTPSIALSYSRLKETSKLNSVKLFLFAGEVLTNKFARIFLANFNNARVINAYGPTEATVLSTQIEITENILNTYNPLPIGYSRKDGQVLIRDGEIVAVGPHVSIGYLNDDELNSKKFTVIDGMRAFKTGDKGYKKGDIVFYEGRSDDQVKLHGYRIELRDVTSAINNLDYVSAGETIALKRNEIVKKIVSLIQVNEAAIPDINAEVVKRDLERTLPSYMIPSDVKFVSEIPINKNGKADKSALTHIYLQK